MQDLELEGTTLGDHVTHIYDDLDEAAYITARFLRQGLIRGMRCLYFADESAIKTVSDTLIDAVVVLAAERERGALSITAVPPGSQHMLPRGPDTIAALMQEAASQAQRDGFLGLWLVADLTWMLPDGPEIQRLYGCEARLDRLVKAAPVAALCQYDQERLTQASMGAVLHSHPLMLHGNIVAPNLLYRPLP